ncbi:hypothetical protein GQ457_06G032670 [Hibiscus cannabinus]
MVGYVQNGYCAEALEIFYHLQPGSTTGWLTLHYIKKNKLFLGVALVDMYSKCESTKNDVFAFEGIESKTVEHWNAMIGGLSMALVNWLSNCIAHRYGKAICRDR